ncbi:MAG: SLC13 family permease [Flaviflexus sp.]|nr:SLC13 family permease [Flaviflexus sp.]
MDNSAGSRPRARLAHRRPPARRQSLSTFQRVGLILGIIAFLAPFAFDIPGLDGPGERMLSIFFLAIVFWITEPIPLVATATLVIFLEVILVSTGAILPVGEEALASSSYFAALANPVIILFLGGFMIADGAEKYRLDKNLAAVMLRPFTGSARITILGLMAITAALSMFMSNTATTATMFAVVMPIISALPDGKSRAGLALSIPLAANVGGIGTPVGTPPNAIAIGALAEHGIKVSFVDWMMMAVPLMLLILVLAWILLSILFVPKEAKIKIGTETDWDTSRPALGFYIVTATTIALWMSEPLHGVSSTTVGFLPVVALLAMRIMDSSDVKKLDWPVLWLVSGGIALGTGVGATGLDEWLVSSINWSSLPALGLIGLLAFIGLAMANVISHSAAANLLVPLAVSLAVSLDSIGTITVAAVVAIACSLGMSLPISTPPNAIAYSTGEISVKNMATIGLLVGILGTLLLVALMPIAWSALGLV